MDAQTDPELMAAARRGDADAFARLMRRHYGDCLRYAMRMMGSRAEAEDAVQEAFIRAYRAVHTYRETGQFKSWLLRILRNRCRSAIARRSNNAKVVEMYSSMTTTHAAPGVIDENVVQNALQQLPPILREAFVLKYVEDLEYEEMHMITGASVSALKMRVQRARAALREMIGGDDVE